MANIFICGDTGQAPLLERVANELRELGHDVVRGAPDVVGTKKTYSAAEQADLIAPADVAVFTTRHMVTRELMHDAPRLRGICFPVTGVETLDISAANDLGLIVGHGSVPGNIIGMAEATVMLMLMCLYDVQTNIGLMAQRKWRRPGHHSRSMAGKTIGLIGFGRIAREIAARLAPFGVRILTASPRARQADLPAGVTKVDLPELMRESDVVSILTGATPETRKMIGAAELAMMKSNAYLVNTGRGEVVDEEALYECLKHRRIAGAALDTFQIEPLPLESPLRQLDNVILTPHCVGHTVEALSELGPAMIENISRVLAGQLPQYCKNPEAETAWRARLARIDGNGVKA